MSSKTQFPESAFADDQEIETRARETDSLVIKTVCLIAVVAIIGSALGFPDTAGAIIDSLRSFVTINFTWYYALFATSALGLCIWLAFGRFGQIRIGGDMARPTYGRFAWYSMLFACGQGIGLIFWSVAEPIMLYQSNPLAPDGGARGVNTAMSWGYFHWAIHAWAIYCIVALCLAYSFYNRNKPLTFRDACIDCLPACCRRSSGLLIETLAILATVLGLSTSFGFAALQFNSGLDFISGIGSTAIIKSVIVVTLTCFTAMSVFIGVNKGMKIISELNTSLSLVLMAGMFVFGPTLYLLSLIPESIGTYLSNLFAMGLWTDAQLQVTGFGHWKESWNGWWTVFIWSWSLSFSPFVGAFIARISHGRTIRDFILGVVVIPSLIVIIWIAIMGGSAIYFDLNQGGTISAAVNSDIASGLFALFGNVSWSVVRLALLVIATVLVATYYITSLDSGIHALAHFVSPSDHPSAWFKVMLVAAIGSITLVLLSLGGTAALATIQTGAILGALPFSFICLLMIYNFIHNLINDRLPGTFILSQDRMNR
ncbi:BCCT family transporter [Laribacter hongkongensis]|uniref:BCCT family transporter n=1 Tax=Laribacter hongkongensis TaxID=168471 RepID=UPI001EFE529E|nr:BCCT family transporter [Laribacter hongkongensis]MCG8995878.1 BCCT family transporter [Laribacter hongkongensis]MCG9011366.1 BCCT family transporter [Laribacter hongkongensis]MCG9023236.1 BCCT family transporter [Laribacter hongkongensis]MCG9047928.1 BCCT family transporter [Laribacter hongkongensis]MCG9074883.1 BCCT family transporter [Laribacter hongkongensis]